MAHHRLRRRAVSAVGVLALALGGLVAFGSVPAEATTVTDETTFRAAWTDVNETQIDLAADITLTCGGGGIAVRNSGTALTLNGHGHTITQTCAGNGVLAQSGNGALTFQDVIITGGAAMGDGGGLFSHGDVTLRDSTVSEDTAGGIGGGITTSGAVTLTNSTVSGNTASGAGGGISVGGAVTLTNSTVSGNTASGAGGGISGGFNSLTLVYATVVDNSAPSGSGSNVNLGRVTSFGSVVALPGGGGSNCHTMAATISNGLNFSDDASCGFSASTDKQNAGDPALGALANNGGPTQTRLPQPGSPLIDAIPIGSCQDDGAAGITTDQRGVTRPQGAGCDIGAAEVQVPGPTPTPPGPTPAPPVEAIVRFTG